PRETRGKEMREPGLFIHRLGECGGEQRQRARRGTAEEIDGGNGEEFEGDHRRDGIARKTKHESVAAFPEDGGLAGTDSDGVEEELRAEILEDGFHEIVF